MALQIIRRRLKAENKRSMQKQQVFRDWRNPLEMRDDFDLIQPFLFDRKGIRRITPLLRDDLTQ